MTAKARLTEPEESRHLVRAGFELARTLGISTLIVQADELRDAQLVEDLREDEQIVWLTQRDEDLPLASERADAALRLPDAPLSRMSQLEVGLLFAVTNKHVDPDESLIFMTGAAGSERLDMIMIAKPRRDFRWLRRRGLEAVDDSLATQEFTRLLDVAIRLASEGREGKRIGTILVLGDEDQVDPYVRQLVLNPCAGHPQRERNIHDSTFFETLREFAALDGAFVVNRRGVVLSAGTYLDAPSKKVKLSPGQGARHVAAASITAITDTVAVAVSESSRTVTVFHDGRSILELECLEPSATP